MKVIRLSICFVVWSILHIQAADKSSALGAPTDCEENPVTRAITVFADIEMVDTPALKKLRADCQKQGVETPAIEDSIANICRRALKEYDALSPKSKENTAKLQDIMTKATIAETESFLRKSSA